MKLKPEMKGSLDFGHTAVYKRVLDETNTTEKFRSPFQTRYLQGTWKLLLLLLLFVAMSTLLELCFSASRYDLIQVTEEIKEDVLKPEEVPEPVPDKTVTGTTVLPYNENFSYPLSVDLVRVINNAIFNGKSISLPVINPHPYPYLIKPQTCSLPTDKSSSKRILVLIKSYIGNIDQRIAIRLLWEDVSDSSMTYFFILGTFGSEPRVKSRRVHQETLLHKDIIQEDFVDSYLNNTLKTIMAFNWAMTACPQADLLLFHDDDYHVQYDELAVYLRSRTKKMSRNVYMGSLAINAPPYREKTEKWYLTYEDYPYDVFPPYLGGGAFVISNDVARKFQLAFPFVKYMGIDDVYLGIVAKKLAIAPQNESRLETVNINTLAKECSHEAEHIVIENCTLAERKREIMALREKNEKYMAMKDIENIGGKVKETFYSFENNFSYPLNINLQAYVNGRLINKYQNRYNQINTHIYKYIYTPGSCKFRPSKVYNENIIVLVKSYIKNFQQREAIRLMWNTSTPNVTGLQVVFLLGLGLHRDIQDLVEEEDGKYGDILQEDFIDSYGNNTLKTIMAFNWVVENCVNVDLLLFMDDDYYFYKEDLLRHLREFPKQRYLFLGNVVEDKLPEREKGQRRNLDPKAYPFDKLPVYVNGGAYVTSIDVAQKLQIAFPYVKYLDIDDIYLGIVSKKLRLNLKHDDFFDPSAKDALLYECSHIPSRLLSNTCPLSGRVVFSNVPKLVKRKNSLWNKLKNFPSFLLN